MLSVCKAGYELRDSRCQRCMKGHYKSVDSDDVCVRCEDGSTTPGEGATSANECSKQKIPITSHN